MEGHGGEDRSGIGDQGEIKGGIVGIGAVLARDETERERLSGRLIGQI